MLKKGSLFSKCISIDLTPMLFAQISTFLSPLSKSSSNLSNRSIDQSPNILCRVLFDLMKKSLFSLKFMGL